MHHRAKHPCMNAATRPRRRLTRRGVVSVLAMMILVLFGSLSVAMAIASQGNLRTASTHLHVLRAMGASEAEAGSAIRISLGWDSGAPDIERFLEAWSALYSRIARGTSARGTPAANPAA